MGARAWIVCGLFLMAGIASAGAPAKEKPYAPGSGAFVKTWGNSSQPLENVRKANLPVCIYTYSSKVARPEDARVLEAQLESADIKKLLGSFMLVRVDLVPQRIVDKDANRRKMVEQFNADWRSFAAPLTNAAGLSIIAFSSDMAKRVVFGPGATAAAILAGLNDVMKAEEVIRAKRAAMQKSKDEAAPPEPPGLGINALDKKKDEKKKDEPVKKPSGPVEE